MSCRCGKDHSGDVPLSPDDLIRRLSQQIADEIDREIVEEILGNISPSRIPPNPEQEDK